MTGGHARLATVGGRAGPFIPQWRAVKADEGGGSRPRRETGGPATYLPPQMAAKRGGRTPVMNKRDLPSLTLN